MQGAAKFWDKTAAKYAKAPIADMESYTYTLERTRSYLAAGDHVLEVGCGTGSTALLLAPSVRQITASDISGNMIGIATDKARDQGIGNVQFIRAGLDELRTDEAAPYDAVLALNLLHLIEDSPAALRRIHQLIKPGGLFISKTVSAFGTGTPMKLRLIKAILPLMQLVGMAPFVRFMTIEALEDLVQSAGFEIIEAGNYPPSPPSRYIVARRIQ